MSKVCSITLPLIAILICSCRSSNLIRTAGIQRPYVSSIQRNIGFNSATHVHTLRGHTETISALAFSSDGKILASGSDDRTIKLWDVQKGGLLRTLPQQGKFVALLTFGPRNRILASTSGAFDAETLGNDFSISIWNVTKGRLQHKLTGHHSTVLSVGFSPDGKSLVSGSQDKTIKLWSARTGKLLKTLRVATTVLSVGFSPDGKSLVSVSQEGILQIREFASGKLRQTLSNQKSVDEIKSFSFSLGQKFFTLAAHIYGGLGDRGQSHIYVWNVQKAQLISHLMQELGVVDAATTSSDGKTIAVSGYSRVGRIKGLDDYQNTIQLWHVR